MPFDTRLREPGRKQGGSARERARGDSGLLGGESRTRDAADGRDPPSRDRRLMPSLPDLNGRQVIKAFEKDGWTMVPNVART
jgi:hypothetical protein